jgi:hypothetical protein
MEDREYFTDDKERECVLNDDNEASMEQGKLEYTGNTIAAKDDRGYKFLLQNCATFAEVKESQNRDNSIADTRELPKNKYGNNEVTESTCTSLCLATTYDVTSSQESGINTIRTDDKMISAEQLHAKVCEGNGLSTEQQGGLYKVLAKYQQHLTKRPGKLTHFEYESGHVRRNNTN